MSREIYHEVMKLKLIYQKMSPREGDISNNKQFFNLPL